MTDMSPTYEKATRCPKCDTPGEVVNKMPAKPVPGMGVRVKPGTQIHTVYCRNEACRWFSTNWIVQVNPDGEVPPPTVHKRGDIDKAFPSRGFNDTEAERVERTLQRQLEQETRLGGGEVRSPYR